jgi:hypothetical protein
VTARRRLRIATVALAWIVAVTALALMDMRPSVTVLAAISVAAASVMWLLLDVGDVAAPVDWRAHSDGGVSTRGADTRVRVLRRQISDPNALEGRIALHRSLLDLVDDALHAAHGVDRLEQPVLAARLMGPLVTSFTTSPTAGDLLIDPSRLNALLDEIERLSTEPRHQEIR